MTHLTSVEDGPRNPLVPEAWIFTFGLGHPLARRYVRLTGDENKCRSLMSQIFGQGNWAACRREDQASSVIDRFKLTRLDLEVRSHDPVHDALAALADASNEELHAFFGSLEYTERLRFRSALDSTVGIIDDIGGH